MTHRRQRNSWFPGFYLVTLQTHAMHTEASHQFCTQVRSDGKSLVWMSKSKVNKQNKGNLGETDTLTRNKNSCSSGSLGSGCSDGVKCAGYSPNSFKLSGSVPTCCLSKANFPGCTIHFFLGVCHCSSSNGKTGRQWGQFSLFPWQLLTGLTVLPLQDQKWEQLLFC